MTVWFFNPFHTGSHKAFAEGLQQHSSHNIELFTLPGRHWKWRMHGAAVAFAQQIANRTDKPDLVMTTDMMDLAAFRGLTARQLSGVPHMVYFHENQLAYPWSPTDPDVALKRDNHYAWINFTTALAADRVYFNSRYNRSSFLDALPDFLKAFPDQRQCDLEALAFKCGIALLGLDLKRFDAFKTEKQDAQPRTILWNHRWEYDKNPEAFFNTLFQLQDELVDFRVVVLGESYGKQPPIFETARERLGEKVLHFGYAESFEEYAKWLWKSDILPVTSIHEFFGISVAEAMYCGCRPLLPNRLAFPERLLGVPDGAAMLYDTDEELAGSLYTLLTSDSSIHSERGYNQGSDDWSFMKAIWDRLIADEGEFRDKLAV